MPERGVMKKIIYHDTNDVVNYDPERFYRSLSQYTALTSEDIVKALEDYEQYETMHVSCLVEAGTRLIWEKEGEAKARAYFNNCGWYGDQKFERLRRITGYLVGTLDRWNDAKRAEEKARVKHSTDTPKMSANSSLNDIERLAALEAEALDRI